MSADETKVKGLRELGEAMDLLPQNLVKKMFPKAVKAGGKVFEDGAKSRAPKLSGELTRKIKAKMSSRNGRVSAIIGVVYGKIRAATSRSGKTPSSEDPGVYAQFDEFGRPNREGHTSQAAQPFIRPTFDEDSNKATEAVANSLRSNLGDLVSK